MQPGLGIRRGLFLVLLAGSVAAIPAEAQPSSAAAQVAFTHGLLAFNHGDDEEAAERFAEAAANDPGDGTFLHWLGLAELRRGRAAAAVARLEESLRAERPPEAGQRRVREDLRLARRLASGGEAAATAVVAPGYRPEVVRLGRVPRWDGRLALESAYDSNPELLPDDQPLLVPGGVPSDGAALLDLRLAHRPFSDLRGWSLEVGVAGHQSLHREVDDLDLSLARAAVSLARGSDAEGFLVGPLGLVRVPAGAGRFALLLQAGGSAAWLGGERLLETADVAAALLVRETSRTATRVSLAGRDRDDSADAPLLLRRSGEELSVGVDQMVRLGRPGRSLRVGARAGEERMGELFDLSYGEASAEVAAPLAPRWSLHLLASLREDRYAEPASNLLQPLGPARDDTTWRLAAAALWQATDRICWTLRGSHLRRDSNVGSLFSYDRTVVALGVEWAF